MAQQWDLGIPWDLENTPGILPPFQPLRSPTASQEPCVGDTYIPRARAFFPPPLLILTPGKQDWTSLVPSDQLSGSLADRGCNFTLPRAILIISPCCWRWLFPVRFLEPRVVASARNTSCRFWLHESRPKCLGPHLRALPNDPLPCKTEICPEIVKS